jgi:acetyltransferase-like isoleucine patch superfamily enzyme
VEWIRPDRPAGDLGQRLRIEAATTPWRLRYYTLPRLASKARRMGLLATHLHADVRIDPTAYLGPGFDLRVLGRATVDIGESAEFRRDFLCEVSPGGKVTIGRRCVFTGMALVQASTHIDFADEAVVGQGCMIADGSHRFRDPETPVLRQGYNHRPVSIGPGAIIHTNAVVTNSVGERAVVAANSVVTRPVPPYCLAGGSPARVIEYFGIGDPPAELAEQGGGRSGRGK